MSKYKIIFRGEILSGHEPEQVQAKFAELFGVSAAHVQPYFEGNRLFVIKDMDLAKTKAYAVAFKKIGIKINVYPPLPKPATNRATQFVICDFCGTKQKSSDRCVQCGIGFAKNQSYGQESTNQSYSQAASSQPSHREEPQRRPSYKKETVTVYSNNQTKAPLAIHDENTEVEHSHKKKASTAFYLTIFSLLAITAVDYMAQQDFIDMGRMPYLLPLVILCYGLYQVAMSKGLANTSIIFRVISLFAEGLTKLVPSRKNNVKGLVFGSPKLLIGLIAVGFIGWGYIQMQKVGAKSEFIASAEALFRVRSDYPTNLIETDIAVIDRIKREMQVFVVRGIGTLLAMDMRPKEVAVMSDAIFKEVSKYFIWLEYQRYLHVRASQRIPYFLSDAIIKVEIVKFKSMFQKIVPVINHRNMSQSYTKWVKGFNIEQIGTLAELQNNLHEVKIALNSYVGQNRKLPSSFDKLIKLQPNIVHLMDAIEWDEKGTITLSTAGDSLLAEKTVVMAYYIHPQSDDLIYTRIGGTLPDKYMGHSYRVLSQMHEISGQP